MSFVSAKRLRPWAGSALLPLVAVLLPACGGDGGSSSAAPAGDTVPPTAVTDLAATATGSSTLSVTWTAPGDDGVTGTAASYDLRYSTSMITAANWDSATHATGEPTPLVAGSSQQRTISGLAGGTQHFVALKSTDDEGNVSALSNIASGTTATPPDMTPPARVTSLTLLSVTASSLTVEWTSPGDDGSTGTAASYDVRTSTSLITSGNWNSATQATGEPSPLVAGTPQQLTISGLAGGTLYFVALKTTDDDGNISLLSNVVSGSTSDVVPPSTITDLTIVDVTATSLIVRWTAPGDDGTTGTAASYDVRYSTSAISDANWDSATPATGEPAPLPAGAYQRIVIPGLTGETPYFIAIKSSDDAPNTSALSNVVSAEPQFRPGVAFLADANVDGRLELLVADFSGTEVRDLSDGIVAGGGVFDFRWSPDRTKIAFLATKEAPDFYSLYVVPADGSSAPVKVSGIISAASTILPSHLWAPDGSRLAFLGGKDFNGNGTQQLHSVLPDGSGLVTLNGSLAPGGDVYYFRWAPDGSRIAYNADQETNDRLELFTSLPDGTGNVKISGPFSVPGQVDGGFRWAPDSSRIAYLADPDTFAQYELFTTLPTDTSSVIKVSQLVISDGDVSPGFAWAPDSSRLGYRANAESLNKSELYSVAADASGHAKLSGTLPATSYVDIEFLWSPDSSRVAYMVHHFSPTRYELRTALADGSGSAQVSDRYWGSDGYLNYEWAPDGTRLAYRGDENDPLHIELYTTLPDGTGKVQASPVLPTGQHVDGFKWSPDSSRILYRANQVAFGELYITGPQSSEGLLQVSGPTQISGQVDYFKWGWSSDGSRICYLADQATDDISELYTSYPEAPVDNVKVSGTLVLNGEVDSFVIR